jgi:hypothetical protein
MLQLGLCTHLLAANQLLPENSLHEEGHPISRERFLAEKFF